MDIEKRARELEIKACALRPHECGVFHAKPWMDTERAIQLAREAADARAEDIASFADGQINDPQQGGHAERQACASALRRISRFARSTIKKADRCDCGPQFGRIAAGFKYAHKPECPEKPEVVVTAHDPSKQRAADAMAAGLNSVMPSILEAYENMLRVAPDGTLSGTLPCGHDASKIGIRNGSGFCCDACAVLAMQKPKTREQRLEAALREIAAQEDGRPFPQLHSVEIARRALEEK